MTRPKLSFSMAKARTRYVFEPDLIDRLATCCDILDTEPIEDFSTPRARLLLAETEILVTGWGCPIVDAGVIAMAPRLKLIAHSAGTVKFLITPEIYEAGIAVTHAADANAVPVAEFTLAAILFSNKQVFRLHRLYLADHSRRLAHEVMDQPIGNYRKTIGLIGASRIGRKVAAFLQPFDFDVLLYDPYVLSGDPVTAHAELVELDDLLAGSDVVSVHAPSLPSTRHMLGQRELGLLRDGATLINTARGALIDEDALLAELRTGRIDAVIDVTDPEIPPPDSDFYRLENVFLTPHVAGAAGTERARLGRITVEEIERFIAGEPMRFAIEPAALPLLA
jgi:phosphoglycerate dehydrogenase-like enzyme